MAFFVCSFNSAYNHCLKDDEKYCLNSRNDHLDKNAPWSVAKHLENLIKTQMLYSIGKVSIVISGHNLP